MESVMDTGKFILSAALAALLSTGAGAQKITDMENNDVLTPRQLALAECACLEARGDMERLDTAVRKALDSGVSVNELKEAFSQLYAYTGFPRSLNALNLLKQVLDDRLAEGKKDDEGVEWKRPGMWDDASAALASGTETQTRLTGGRGFSFDFCPQADHYLKAHLFGDIFAGETLSAADREIVTVAALSGMQGVESQLASHKRGAVCMGNTQEQVDALCRHLDSLGLTLKSEFEKGVPNDGYAQYFSGRSWLNPIRPVNLAEGETPSLQISDVTFEPGCRNNWHIHHGFRQILICVSGKGLYQEWGKKPIELKPGDVVDIPEGVKHWHGAQEGSWFQHLTTHVATGGEQSNEWLEPVEF